MKNRRIIEIQEEKEKIMKKNINNFVKTIN